MSSTASLVADYLARGGQIGRAPCRVPPEMRNRLRARPEDQPANAPVPTWKAHDIVAGFYGAYRACLDAMPAAPAWSVDEYAAYVPSVCDPLAEIAEAAGIYVIARDEGPREAQA